MAAPLYLSKPLQHLEEHDRFLGILRRENVRSYMEIGSMYGGSLWRVAHALPVGSRVVAVDYFVDTPDARPHLEECVEELQREYDARLVLGDSTATETIESVRDLGPFDCVFIDGAHTLEGVTADWENYGPMGRIVAFHDIAWNDTWRSSVPGRPFKAMGVPQLWNSLKEKYRHEEIKLRTPSNYYGIGVLWR
jgi:predicted O-methyltransferase YrrM